MAEPTIITVHKLTTHHRSVDGSPSFSAAQLYDSLQVDQGSIRVLDLEPEPRHLLQHRSRQPVEPPLRGTLRVVSMKDCPEFAALSYVWGSRADPPDIILCNGCKIEITSNCKDALQAVRKSQGRVTIWVDAICINQKDKKDKASQIPNMEDIYTWARMVYVWLGRGDERIYSGMKMLRWASRYSLCLAGNRIRRPNCRLAGRGGPGDPWMLCKEDLKDCWVLFRSVAPWNPYVRQVIRKFGLETTVSKWSPEHLDSLLSGPWIGRAWTFQELILAQDVTIMCGEPWLGWDYFIRGLWLFACGDDCGTLRESLNLGRPEMSIFKEWNAMLTLWMNIKRKSAWGTRNMRCGHASGATIENHQSPILLRRRRPLVPNTELRRHSYVRVFTLRYSLLLDERVVIVGAHCAVYLLWVLIGVGILFTPLITLLLVNKRACVCGGFGTLVAVFIASPILFGIVWLVSLVFTYRSPVAFGGRAEREIDTIDELVRVIPQVTKHRAATEPRDRVYATYGILRSFDIPLSEINYEKSEDQVYSDFFLDLLRSSSRYLIFIIDAGFSDDTDIPSWVPNWKTALERSWLPPSIYSSRRSEGAIGSPQVQLQGKNLRVRNMVVCQVGFITETFEKIEHDQADELAVKLEKPVATLCQLIHRARDLSFNPAYETIIKSILQTINAFEPESEQFEDFSIFSNLYEKLKAGLRQVGGVQVDYVAISRKVLREHIHSLEYAALADLFNKFAKRGLFDTFTGDIGSGPPRMRAGDVVVRVAGVPVPMILRETEILDTYVTENITE
ncbi:heterokaryon incompatibility protein-domain-containing protein [Xylaria digitata]|nr:heterokaryon incompatibility protein-domain-containing protein [Xylaria digitata]